MHSHIHLTLVNDTLGCGSRDVDFTSTSIVSGGVQDIFWEFGDGNASSELSPSHFYETNDQFLVTLTILSNHGCTAEYSRFINVNNIPQPVANFAFSPSNPKKDQEITFTDLSSNAQSWQWNFGDGTTAITPDASHTYEGIHNYSVYLAIANEHCRDTAFGNVFITEELLFYIPNAFTPDDGSINGTFQPVFTSGFDPYDYRLIIYNRWGEAVFESYNSEIGWDGYFDNAVVDPGVYIWQVKFGRSNLETLILIRYLQARVMLPL